MRFQAQNFGISLQFTIYYRISIIKCVKKVDSLKIIYLTKEDSRNL